MQTGIDHLVIGAADLRQGVSYIKETLGVDIPFGGVHPKMGTHNHLMRLGDGVFLEVIAINPDIEQPKRPRWYGLDDPYIKSRIEQQPTLLTWVVNTGDIEGLMNSATFSFGTPELITRGNLSWYFGVPEDGRLLASGLLPYVIEWQTSPHPAGKMADLGCRLTGLQIHHSQPAWIESILESIDASALVEVKRLPRDSKPYLAARLETPSGTKELRSGVEP